MNASTKIGVISKNSMYLTDQYNQSYKNYAQDDLSKIPLPYRILSQMLIPIKSNKYTFFRSSSEISESPRTNSVLSSLGVAEVINEQENIYKKINYEEEQDQTKKNILAELLINSAVNHVLQHTENIGKKIIDITHEKFNMEEAVNKYVTSVSMSDSLRISGISSTIPTSTKESRSISTKDKSSKQDIHSISTITTFSKTFSTPNKSKATPSSHRKTTSEETFADNDETPISKSKVNSSTKATYISTPKDLSSTVLSPQSRNTTNESGTKSALNTLSSHAQSVVTSINLGDNLLQDVDKAAKYWTLFQNNFPCGTQSLKSNKNVKKNKKRKIKSAMSNIAQLRDSIAKSLIEALSSSSNSPSFEKLKKSEIYISNELIEILSKEDVDISDIETVNFSTSSSKNTVTIIKSKDSLSLKSSSSNISPDISSDSFKEITSSSEILNVTQRKELSHISEEKTMDIIETDQPVEKEIENPINLLSKKVEPITINQQKTVLEYVDIKETILEDIESEKSPVKSEPLSQTSVNKYESESSVLPSIDEHKSILSPKSVKSLKSTKSSPSLEKIDKRSTPSKTSTSDDGDNKSKSSKRSKISKKSESVQEFKGKTIFRKSSVKSAVSDKQKDTFVIEKVVDQNEIKKLYYQSSPPPTTEPIKKKFVKKSEKKPKFTKTEKIIKPEKKVNKLKPKAKPKKVTEVETEKNEITETIKKTEIIDVPIPQIKETIKKIIEEKIVLERDPSSLISSSAVNTSATKETRTEEDIDFVIVRDEFSDSHIDSLNDGRLSMSIALSELSGSISSIKQKNATPKQSIDVQSRAARRGAEAQRRRDLVEKKRKEEVERRNRANREKQRKEDLKLELENERKQYEEERSARTWLHNIWMQEEEQKLLNEKRRKLANEELDIKRKEDKKKKIEKLREEQRLLALQRKMEEEEMTQNRLDEKRREQLLLDQMKEEERLEYERQKAIELERLEKQREIQRIRQQEEARLAMIAAKRLAVEIEIHKAELERRIQFNHTLKVELNGLERTQEISRAFIYSYYQLLKWLGVDMGQIKNLNDFVSLINSLY
ncbi:hypothetical protein A3Q56_01771 [Intoshia linei]|uniref:Uncharacterized protein n=1 Tax=Intoshia linei TaxID=1819745 RepID=A0A177B9Z0_9BILA|nr:hypothetical protein A3Q56_01771 [Intoshia linei]